MSRVLPVMGHKGYSISEDGRVLGLFGRPLKPRLRKSTGYYAVVLNRPTKSYYVHRLVAMHFIDNLKNKPQVNHKDGDKSNNHAKNLEWATHSENELHSYRVLGKQPTYGKSSLCIKLRCTKGESEQIFESIHEATRETGYSRSRIYKFINQSSKDPEGFTWCKT